jgi:hypothetical protein
MLDLCPPHLAMGSTPYYSGVLTQTIQWALRFGISIEQPFLVPCYVTIHKNPILGAPKCHLQVNELGHVQIMSTSIVK